MENEDWIFTKWPDWLRWVCFIPAGIIGFLLFTIISNISMNMIGYGTPELSQGAGVIGFIITMYHCVPKFKEIVAGIATFAISLIALFYIFSFIVNDTWYSWSCLVYILIFAAFFISSIDLFIKYGKSLVSKPEEASN